jgi:uncharacterized repeat protein (TIGR03806 family)
MFRRIGGRFRVFLAAFFAAASPLCAVEVLTYHNDPARTGLNALETILTPTNVNSSTFGRVAAWAVDGYLYAQPLVLDNATVGGHVVSHVVIAATEHNTVYAFDGDGGDGAAPLWKASFIDSAAGVTTVPSDDTGSGDLVPEIGITATPAIDREGGVLYFEAKTKENGVYAHRLHALSLDTGAEMPGSPVLIQPTARGSASDADTNGVISFNALKHLARPALALLKPRGRTNAVVIVTYTSHGDFAPYHGWVLAFDASTLAPAGVFNDTPNGAMAGIWMAGNGPAVDSDGSVFVMTGNGSFNASAGNYGDSFVKLTPTGTNLAVADYFTPFNQDALATGDLDLGSGGAMILPDEAGSDAHPHLLIGAGKEGRVYLVDRDQMGGFNPAGDTQIVQSLPPGTLGGVWSNPAYFRNRIYYQGSADVLKAFSISKALLSTGPVLKGSTIINYPGATPSISADGTNNGIAWIVDASKYASKGPAVLHAYDADDLSRELYNSQQSGLRDTAGVAAKFSVPVIANGRVFVATANELDVYGVGLWAAAPVIAPAGGVFTTSVMVTMTDDTPGATIRFTTDGTPPSPASKLYSGPFEVNQTTKLRARAYADGRVASPEATATLFSTSTTTVGGLLGQYWANQTGSFDGPPTLTRVDPVIDFTWNTFSPDPSIPPQHYSVRWIGDVHPQFSEDYTFFATADDGVRLWVNGALVIDGWKDQLATKYQGTIALVAGVAASLRLEYYQNAGPASVSLSWASATTPFGIIPKSYLTPPQPAPSISLAVNPGDAAVAGPASLTLAATATSPDSVVASVDFFLGTNHVGVLSNAPFVMTATNVGSGSWVASAVATDIRGFSTRSSNVVVQVVTITNAPAFGIDQRPKFSPYLNLPVRMGGAWPALLSQTGVFLDTPGLTPTTGLIPYEVNAPFWSDGAIKQRWLGVPYGGGLMTPSNQVAYAQDGPWDFPAGSVFVKHFTISTNETASGGASRRLETRVLVDAGGGVVQGATYRWRPDGSDADLVTAAQTETVTIVEAAGSRTQSWYYPSPSDCVVCHNPAAGGILGASKTRQLARTAFYPGTGRTDNQIRVLNHLGMFNPAINQGSLAALPRYAAVDDPSAALELRARSYLDVNCAYCHQPGGAGRAAFDLRIVTQLDQAGLVRGPVAATLGIPGAVALAPGDELRSMIYRRTATNLATLRMPPLGRMTTDNNGLALLGQWIDSLVPPPPPLDVRHVSRFFTLSWPASTNAYFLEMSSGAAGPWVAGPSPSLQRSNYVSVVPVGAPVGFFRLTTQAPLP